MPEPTTRSADESPSTLDPTGNIAALIGLGSGILGLFVLPILLGPVAFIAGFVGLAQKSKGGTGLSVAAIIVGVLAIVIMLTNVSNAAHQFSTP